MTLVETSAFVICVVIFASAIAGVIYLARRMVVLQNARSRCPELIVAANKARWDHYNGAGVNT